MLVTVVNHHNNYMVERAKANQLMTFSSNKTLMESSVAISL